MKNCQALIYRGVRNNKEPQVFYIVLQIEIFDKTSHWHLRLVNTTIGIVTTTSMV